jgi:alkylhydroperoxidase/carboxymuconolactone decarboxylase family protein YurZ
MNELQVALTQGQLEALRNAYDAGAMRNAMLAAISNSYPALDNWNRAIDATFYQSDRPLAPRDRERCLIAILSLGSPPLSLAIHVYWGLMEGLGVDELRHVVALAACYGGVPRLAHGLPIVDRVVALLTRCVDRGTVSSAAVLFALLEELSGSLR